MLLGITGMQAQEFTLEYNIGYGLYNMSEMKDFLSNAAGSSLKGVKTTDKFRGTLHITFGLVYRYSSIR